MVYRWFKGNINVVFRYITDLFLGCHYKCSLYQSTPFISTNTSAPAPSSPKGNSLFSLRSPVHSPWRECFYIRDVGNRRSLGAVLSRLSTATLPISANGPWCRSIPSTGVPFANHHPKKTTISYHIPSSSAYHLLRAQIPTIFQRGTNHEASATAALFTTE